MKKQMIVWPSKKFAMPTDPMDGMCEATGDIPAAGPLSHMFMEFLTIVIGASPNGQKFYQCAAVKRDTEVPLMHPSLSPLMKGFCLDYEQTSI